MWPTLSKSNRVVQELNHLTNSFAQLKQAQAKFKACIENAAEIKPQNKGALSCLTISFVCLTFFSLDKTILVPLTNSLYVPGKLSDPDHVIVDVGTGYFVQKVMFNSSIPVSFTLISI